MRRQDAAVAVHERELGVRHLARLPPRRATGCTASTTWNMPPAAPEWP